MHDSAIHEFVTKSAGRDGKALLLLDSLTRMY